MRYMFFVSFFVLPALLPFPPDNERLATWFIFACTNLPDNINLGYMFVFLRVAFLQDNEGQGTYFFLACTFPPRQWRMGYMFVFLRAHFYQDNRICVTWSFFLIFLSACTFFARQGETG